VIKNSIRARAFATTKPSRLVEPDVISAKSMIRWQAFLNEDDMPQLPSQPHYRRCWLRDAADRDVRNLRQGAIHRCIS